MSTYQLTLTSTLNTRGRRNNWRSVWSIEHCFCLSLENSMGCYPGPAPVLTPHGRRMCPGGARCSEDISWRYLAISGEAISGHLMENRIFVRRSAVVASPAETAEMGSATRTWTLAPVRRCELAKLIISIYLPDTLDTLDTRYRCIYTSHLSLLYTKNGDLKSIQWQLAMK